MYTVVVADDEEELRRAIIRKIDWEEIGFEVVGEAENGAEALELVEKKKPDLLITDIRMPYVTGIELARQVREIRPTTQIAFLSGYDEFSYAQQAIQYNIISYMLKPITMAALTEELKRIREKIDGIFAEFGKKEEEKLNPGEFVIPLLLDDYPGYDVSDREEALLKDAVKYGLIKENGIHCYTVIVIMVCDKEGRNLTRPEYADSVNKIIKRYASCTTFAADGKIVSLLCATRGTLEKYLHIIAGYLVQSTERILSLNCNVGISRIKDNLSECHEAYQGAMRALGYRKPKESSIHYIADEERQNTFDMSKVADMVSGLENLIRGGLKEEVVSYIDNIFAKIDGEADYRLKCSFLVLEMSSSLLKMVYTITDDAELLRKFSLLSSSTGGDVKEQFKKLCMEVWEIVNTGKMKSSQIICKRALQIIDNEYSNPELSLVGVSNEIHVSPNYLSALIKKEEGASFIDILTKKRIEKAIEYVTTTPMKMREIAEKCGYSDQHYFSYCFKKYCKVSPNAMRQEMEKTNE